ncbi:MAG: hypothetical protein ACK5AV_02985 [Alphaproteobacteria bacterium]|jgi:hypothetical protein|nr:hypothetical protein [Candidatus Jidaibacter sp.]
MIDFSKNFIEAIEKNDHELLAKMIADGADVNMNIYGSSSPLIYTITHSKLTSEQKISTVNKLLELGASVNKGSSESYFRSSFELAANYPIEHAIKISNKDLVELFLSKRTTQVDYAHCLRLTIDTGNQEIAKTLLLNHKSIDFIEILGIIDGGLYGSLFFGPTIKSKEAAQFLLKEYKNLLINNEIKVRQPLENNKIIAIIDKTLTNPTMHLGHTTVLKDSKVIVADNDDFIYMTPKLLESKTSCHLTKGENGEINGWASGVSYTKQSCVGPASHVLVKAVDHSFKATIDFSGLNVHSIKDLDITEHKLGEEPYTLLNIKDTPCDIDLIMLYGISKHDLVDDMFMFAPEEV